MTFDWHTLYAEALETFGGDPPGAALEQQLLDAFRDHPQAVTNAVRKIGKAHKAGRIHSPWGALKAEIPKQIAADIHVGDGHERTRAIANAEQWLRNAGLMYDRWTEAHDELFGDRGNLHPWHKDHALIAQLETLWLELRPTGEQTEADEIERAEQWKQFRAELASKPRVEPQDAHALITGGPSANPA